MISLALTVALGFGACGGDDAGTSDEAADQGVSTPTTVDADSGASDGPTFAVVIEDFAFTPDTIEVAAGTTVVWTNGDEFKHTVTSGETSGEKNVPDGMFDEPTDDKGDAAEVTFDEPGTYTYYCKQHNAMNGTVTVT